MLFRSFSATSLSAAEPVTFAFQRHVLSCSVLNAMAAAFLFFSASLSNLTAATIDLTRDVESILIKRCSESHGPDQQKSKLRLDSRTAALQAGKSGHPAVVPGQPEASELIKRVTSSDPDDIMPPKGARLTEQEVTSIRRWIQEGAIWPELDIRRHWAFVKPDRPTPPDVSQTDRARNEIDRFVLARLERERLSPQVEADRYTLARRLSLDLTGLPPSWEEVQAFVKDTSPNAYEKLVDRLLTSPHYGEHMARDRKSVV